MKIALILAPSREDAGKYIEVLYNSLKKNGIDSKVIANDYTCMLTTSEVIMYAYWKDPIRWTISDFHGYDVMFGNNVLTTKAEKTFPGVYFNRPKGGVTRWIINQHKNTNSDAATHKYNSKNIPEIKTVHFNYPATVVLWEDGTKTVVKCNPDDFYSPETGLALCIAKKSLGNQSNFNNIINKWVNERYDISD